MESFGYPNDLVDASVNAKTVECAEVFDAQVAVPFFALFVNRKELVLIGRRTV